NWSMTLADVSVNGAARGDRGRGASSSPGAGEAARVRVLHAAVPGRLRLSVPLVKRDPDLAQRLESLAQSWKGVGQAVANAATGSLLLEYDPATATPPDLAAQAQAEANRIARRAGDPRPVRGRSGANAQGRTDRRAPTGSTAWAHEL